MTLTMRMSSYKQASFSPEARPRHTDGKKFEMAGVELEAGSSSSHARASSPGSNSTSSASGKQALFFWGGGIIYNFLINEDNLYN